MLLKEKVPHELTVDSTLALSQEGYLFIKNRVDKYQSDLFETRLMGQKSVCMSGEEAVRLFYNSELFQRNGAVPKRVQRTLFGEGAIQTLDGEEHIHRKQLFMSLMTQLNQMHLAEFVMEKWEEAARKWEVMEEVVLFNEAAEVLCKAACQWAEVPLSEAEARSRGEDFIHMIYAMGAVGPQHWKGRRARGRAEEWIRGIIEDVRGGRLKAKEGSALYAMAFYKQLDGSELSVEMAAKELINILRPIVAIATFITFAALALKENPKYINKLREGGKEDYELFAQEVRRYYPFGPFVGARVKKDFTWRDCEFKEGMLVLLDMYGTNHDSRIWKNPERFMPERFEKWDGDLFNFIPQGGGNPAETHRCPGEGITVEVMRTSLNFIINKLDFEVPEQDLSYSLAKVPTLPESGFIIRNVRRR